MLALCVGIDGKRLGSKLYKLSATARNQSYALAGCKQWAADARLAVATSDAENTFIKGLSTASKWMGVKLSYATVGLDDRVLEYTSYAAGVPQSCVSLSAGGVWTPTACTTSMVFVCERALPGIFCISWTVVHALNM